MNEWFEKAPLQELVVELQWGAPGQGPAAGVLSFDNSADEFLMRFAGSVGANGFSQAERMVPQGMPYLTQAIAYRFRNPNDKSLLQVGPGIFSANALPPYKRWSDFRPIVENGIRSLLAVRPAAQQNMPFFQASLRYINAFSGDLLGGKTEAQFISDILSLKVEMPAPINDLIGDRSKLSTSINLLFPTADAAKTVRINVGDGSVNIAKAVILDMTVAETRPVAATFDAVMASFDSSRKIIHKCFVDLTTEIHELMGLHDEGQNAP